MNSSLEKALMESIVRISSMNNPNDMGTGFIFYRDESFTYILTCQHVVLDIVGYDNKQEYLIAGGLKAEIVAEGQRSGMDIAILKVNGLRNQPILKLSESALKGDRFISVGYSNHTENNIPVIGCVEGYINDEKKAESIGTGSDLLEENIRFPLWYLKADESGEDNKMRKGYSGSPLCNQVTGRIVGIVSHKDSKQDDFSGLAISTKALQYIWRDRYLKLVIGEAQDQVSSNNRAIYLEKVRWIISRLCQFDELQIDDANCIIFSEENRVDLDKLCDELQFSQQVARELEIEASKPFVQYERQISRYKQHLSEMIRERDGTLRDDKREILKSLNNEDIKLDREGIALAYIRLGREFINDDKKLDIAIHQFQEAIKCDNQSATAYYGLGAALYKNGKTREAIENLEKARDMFIESSLTNQSNSHDIDKIFMKADNADAEAIEEILNIINPANVWRSRAVSFLKGVLIIPLFLRE